jgi:hypothetical protein
MTVNLDFLDLELLLFNSSYFSENLVAPGIEPRISGFIARNSNHLTTEPWPTRGSHSVDIFHLWIKSTKFSFFSLV